MTNKNWHSPMFLGTIVFAEKTETLTKENAHGSVYRNGCPFGKLYGRRLERQRQTAELDGARDQRQGARGVFATHPCRQRRLGDPETAETS